MIGEEPISRNNKLQEAHRCYDDGTFEKAKQLCLQIIRKSNASTEEPIEASSTFSSLLLLSAINLQLVSIELQHLFSLAHHSYQLLIKTSHL